MQRDCFGEEVTDVEVARWNRLNASDAGFCHWDETFAPVHGEVERYAAERFWEQWIPVKKKERACGLVMEFGCGRGDNARAALRYADQYVGWDISSLIVAMARYRFQSYGQMRFWHTVHDCATMTNYYGKVGGIFGVNFFYHQPDERTRGMVLTAGKLLKPGGWMLIDYHNDEKERPTHLPDDWEGPEGWPSYNVSDDAIRAMANDAQFASVEHLTRHVDAAWGIKGRNYYILRK